MSNYRASTTFTLAAGYGCIAAIVQLAVAGGIIYAVAHFVSNYW